MKRLHHTLPFLTLLALPLSAHEGHPHVPPALYADKLAYAPRPLPDRIVLTWRGDPATTQAVTWRTDTTITRGVAEFAVANEAGRTLKGESVTARTEPLTTDLSEAHYHSAEFTGLTPETLYAYRVGDGVNFSEWFHFRTASRDAKKFTFVYFGDAQNDIRTHWSRVFREAFREAPRAAFTLHAGDLINNAHRDGQWGEWHGAPAWVNATIPVVPTPGNHEFAKLDEKDANAPRALSVQWRPQFTLPEHGPAELAETCYWFDYQGTRIISLDCARYWRKTHSAGRSSRFTIRYSRPPTIVTIPRSAPCGSRSSTSSKSISCSPVTTTPTLAVATWPVEPALARSTPPRATTRFTIPRSAPFTSSP